MFIKLEDFGKVHIARISDSAFLTFLVTGKRSPIRTARRKYLLKTKAKKKKNFLKLYQKHHFMIET